MNVLALIEQPGNVCCRYRIDAYAGAGLAAGTGCRRSRSERGRLRFLPIMRVADADLVILRASCSSWQLSLVRRLAKSLVYDFDDAVFQPRQLSSQGTPESPETAAISATIRAADTVIAGNAYLGRHASRTGRRTRPHRADHRPDRFLPPGHPCPHRAGRSAGLDRLVEHSPGTGAGRQASSQAAGERTAGLELHLVCDRMADFPGVAVVPRRWSAATEAEDVAAADVGVSYLPDDAWSRGKCGLKVLQYMAAGLPVVANPVGMNRAWSSTAKPLLAPPGEWAAIARLAADPALRRRMGAAGRRAVEQRYSVERWGPQWADILESAVRRPLTEKVRVRAIRAPETLAIITRRVSEAAQPSSASWWAALASQYCRLCV